MEYVGYINTAYYIEHIEEFVSSMKQMPCSSIYYDDRDDGERQNRVGRFQFPANVFLVTLHDDKDLRTLLSEFIVALCDQMNIIAADGAADIAQHLTAAAPLRATRILLCCSLFFNYRSGASGSWS